MSSIGRRIRNRRIAIDWSQDRLSRATGLSKGFLSDLENDKRAPSADSVLKIGKALGLSCDYIIAGTEHPAWVRQVEDFLGKL